MRGHQILHRQRIAKPQSVDARHRHAMGIEPRDDQRGQLAAFLHQHHDVARLRAALAALDQRETGALTVEPPCDLLGDLVRQLAVVTGKPAFLLVAIVVRFGDADFLPQRHLSRRVVAQMRAVALFQPQPFRPDGAYRVVDKAEDGLVGAIAAFEIVFAQSPVEIVFARFARS